MTVKPGKKFGFQSAAKKGKGEVNKKFELMLTRRAIAYSSSGSVV